METKEQLTINKVKEILREGSILIDEIKDPLFVRQYLWRLESRNIIYIAAESNQYLHFCPVRKELNF